MAEHLLSALSLLRIASAGIAAALVYFAWKSWHKTKDQRMFRLLIGFGILMVSVLIEGASFQLVFPGNLVIAHLLEAGTQLLAMIVLLWSLL